MIPAPMPRPPVEGVVITAACRHCAHFDGAPAASGDGAYPGTCWSESSDVDFVRSDMPATLACGFEASPTAPLMLVLP